jgi:DNA (cytosine-5)-methyltransferase 1
MQQLHREIIVDNFAGGGGASTGIELAIGRSVDIAINHDPVAISMHKANHPNTEHYCESVWEVDPRKAVKGRPVALCWLSPDCKHFSKAKGGKPVEKEIRGLAWVGVRWAATVRPRVIILENVEEFKTWGPLLKDGKPDPKQKGRTFNCFVNALKRQGHKVDWRELRACDYGAPTIRKRLFLIARCDGRPIVWPKPTHGDPASPEVKSGKLKPWRTAAEIIDWSILCPSIFDTSEEIKVKHGIKAVRPLADNTMCRVARGLHKFVISNTRPFIIPIAHYNGSTPIHSINEPLRTVTAYPKGGHFALTTPFLTQYHSYDGDGARGQVLDRPLLTVDTNPRYALTAAFISKYYGTGEGSSLSEPLHTVTSKDRNAIIETHLCVLRNRMDCKELREPLPTIMTSPGHFAEVRTVLTKTVGKQDLGYWPAVREMLNKYCDYSIADDEILLLNIAGSWHFISDIGIRMLEPYELFAAQGFPATYIIDRDTEGNKLSKATQVAKCGNAVPPPFSEHLFRANLPELCAGGYERLDRSGSTRIKQFSMF